MGPGLLGVCDILYLSLSISADRLLPVNKVEVVKGGTHLSDDIRSFCQITYTITSWRAVAGYITCANQVVIDLFPRDSPQVQKQITDISSVVSSSSFNMPHGNSSNTSVLALLVVEESFNNFCNHLKLPLMGCCNLIPQEPRCLQALIVTVLLGSNHSPQLPPVTWSILH